MIAPLAITLALALWQPYTPIDPATGQHTPVCPNGVHITYERPAPGLETGWVDQVPNTDCAMHINTDVSDQRIEYQCYTVAHELGHAAFGLPDSTTGGIMQFDVSKIPGGCYPKCFQAVAGECATHSNPVRRRLSQLDMAPARRQPPGAWHRRSIFDAGQHYRPPGRRAHHVERPSDR